MHEYTLTHTHTCTHTCTYNHTLAAPSPSGELRAKQRVREEECEITVRGRGGLIVVFSLTHENGLCCMLISHFYVFLNIQSVPRTCDDV